MRGLDSNADNGAKIVPWGWNYVLRERLLKEGVSSSILPSDEQLDHIRLFSGRSLAFEAHEFLLGFLSRIPVSRNLYAAPSGCRKMCRSAAELDAFLRSHENIVLKAPLSGSGKGIRFVRGTLSHSDRGWAENLMRRYGYLVAERRAESEERSYSEKKEVTHQKFRTLSHIRKKVLRKTLLCYIFVLYSINIFHDGRK